MIVRIMTMMLFVIVLVAGLSLLWRSTAEAQGKYIDEQVHKLDDQQREAAKKMVLYDQYGESIAKISNQVSILHDDIAQIKNQLTILFWIISFTATGVGGILGIYGKAKLEAFFKARESYAYGSIKGKGQGNG